MSHASWFVMHVHTFRDKLMQAYKKRRLLSIKNTVDIKIREYYSVGCSALPWIFSLCLEPCDR
jgi:hypothetical protein